MLVGNQSEIHLAVGNLQPLLLELNQPVQHSSRPEEVSEWEVPELELGGSLGSEVLCLPIEEANILR